ncbi:MULTISPECIES: hypothetical protein [Halomicrobium]|nr:MULTISPECIES: hypothetical protein [Halomicrobium]
MICATFAYETVEIGAGETVTVDRTLDDRALGRSSRDLRLSADIER